MAANSFYLDEVQEYLDYIRTIGMEAWIPDSPGYGPKIPVPDQCRFGVLCLNYKGSDIYIRSNSHRAMNLAVVPGSTYSSENRRRSVRQNPVGIAVVDYGYESRNRFFVVDREENYGITERVPSKRSVGVQCGDGLIRYNGNHFYYSLMSHRDDCNGSTRTCTAGYDGNSVITDSRSYSIPETGVHYKRIVNDKLTKEVRVAKIYVSTLPISGENRRDHHRHHQYRVNNMSPSDHTDFKNRRIQSEMVRLNSKGVVRKLIERFDVFNRDQDKN